MSSENDSTGGQVLLYHCKSNFVTATAWYGLVSFPDPGSGDETRYGLVCNANGRARTIVIPFRKGRKKALFVIP